MTLVDEYFNSASVSSVPVEAWVAGLVVIAVTRLLYFRYKNGFSKHKGPFLASFTDLWRLLYAYLKVDQAPMLDVHEKYGDVVRLGPNMFSFAKPEAIKDIYGAGKAWDKVCYVSACTYDERLCLPTSSLAFILFKQLLREVIARILSFPAQISHTITLSVRRLTLLSPPPNRSPMSLSFMTPLVSTWNS